MIGKLIVGGLVKGLVTQAVTEVAKRAVESGRSVSPAAVADAAANAVVNNKTMQNQMNMEPLYKSRVFLASLGGVFTSLGGLLGLYAAGELSMASAIPLIGALFTSLGAIYGRVTNKPALFDK